MRIFAIGMVALVAGCSTTGGHPGSQGVVMHASKPAPVQPYNDEIKKQGLDHYCPEHQCDTLPSLLRGPAPVYPPALLAEGISGQATIIFNIDKDGRTVDLKLESASRPAFAKAAMAALKQWQFKPATLNGKPVKISCQQEFPFRARYGPSD